MFRKQSFFKRNNHENKHKMKLDKNYKLKKKNYKEQKRD